MNRFTMSIKGGGIIRLKDGDPAPMQFGLDEGDVIVCDDCGVVVAYPHDGIRLHPDLIVSCGCLLRKGINDHENPGQTVN
jgi:hypothetical protein